jgi:hypothetical protein
MMRTLLALSLLLSACAHDGYVVERVVLEQAKRVPPGERRTVAVEAWPDGRAEPVWLRAHALDRNPPSPSPARGLVRVRLREPRWGVIVCGISLAVGAAVLGGGVWRVEHPPADSFDLIGMLTTASGAVQSAIALTFLTVEPFQKPWLVPSENRDILHLARPRGLAMEPAR